MSKDILLAQVASSCARSVICVQMIIAALSGLIFFLALDSWAALSAWYGGMAAVALAFLLNRRIRRAGNVAEHSQKRGMIILYAGLAQRFMLMMLLLGLGLVQFKLYPLAVIAGFALTQLGYLIAGIRNIKA
ncbi:MAG: ATP synthase subunit I [Pseudomonadota bacterium]